MSCCGGAVPCCGDVGRCNGSLSHGYAGHCIRGASGGRGGLSGGAAGGQVGKVVAQLKKHVHERVKLKAQQVRGGLLRVD
jgi:hypothetical protein